MFAGEHSASATGSIRSDNCSTNATPNYENSERKEESDTSMNLPDLNVVDCVRVRVRVCVCVCACAVSVCVSECVCVYVFVSVYVWV